MFQSITPPSQTPVGSFRLRLRTAFSPSRNAYASSNSSTSTTSPLSRRESDEFSPGSFFSSTSNSSTFSASSRLRALLMRHHKPSITDLRLQEEKITFRSELSLLEPRPQSMMVIGGIFEVLEGRA